MESISFSRYMMYEDEKSRILEAIYLLDRQLKQLHSANLYVPFMNAENIVYNADDTFSFKNIEKIPYDKQECIKSNIINFTRFSLGVYASLEGDKTSFTDYTRLDETFIKENYSIIRGFIPYGEEYYDEIIINQNYQYYSDYVDKKRLENASSKASSNQLVKATAAGRVYSDEKSAFSDTLFYPLVFLLFIMFSIICYFVFLGIRG